MGTNLGGTHINIIAVAEIINFNFFWRMSEWDNNLILYLKLEIALKLCDNEEQLKLIIYCYVADSRKKKEGEIDLVRFLVHWHLTHNCSMI